MTVKKNLASCHGVDGREPLDLERLTRADACHAHLPHRVVSGITPRRTADGDVVAEPPGGTLALASPWESRLAWAGRPSWQAVAPCRFDASTERP